MSGITYQNYIVLIPVVKGWSTEIGTQITSQALQVHGGMGFIEETGAASAKDMGAVGGLFELRKSVHPASAGARNMMINRQASPRGLVIACCGKGR